MLPDIRLKRRKFLESAFASVITLCVPQFSTSQETKESVTRLKEGECDEKQILPNVKPQFKIGETYKYKSSIMKGSSSQSIEAKEEAPGRFVIDGESMPRTQTITIAKEKKHAGEACFVIERKGIVENPLSSSTNMRSEVRSVSYVSKAGRVLSSEDTEIIKSGQSTSESTSSSSDLPASATLHYFFGYWMLALAKEFSWECQRASSDGEPSFRSIKVLRTERLIGKECFVVEFLQRRGSKGTAVTTFWVDTKERVSLQVRKGNVTMKRII